MHHNTAEKHIWEVKVQSSEDKSCTNKYYSYVIPMVNNKNKY